MLEEMNRMKQEHAKKVENLIEKISMLQVEKKNLKKELKDLIGIREYNENDYDEKVNQISYIMNKILVLVGGLVSVLFVSFNNFRIAFGGVGIIAFALVSNIAIPLIMGNHYSKKARNALSNEFIKEMDDVSKELERTSKELRDAMKELKKLKNMTIQILLEKTPEMIEKKSEYEMQQYYQTFDSQNFYPETTMSEMDIQKNPYAKTIQNNQSENLN